MWSSSSINIALLRSKESATVARGSSDFCNRLLGKRLSKKLHLFEPSHNLFPTRNALGRQQSRFPDRKTVPRHGNRLNVLAASVFKVSASDLFRLLTAVSKLPDVRRLTE
jgi:hypothetical protein